MHLVELSGSVDGIGAAARAICFWQAQKCYNEVSKFIQVICVYASYLMFNPCVRA